MKASAIPALTFSDAKIQQGYDAIRRQILIWQGAAAQKGNELVSHEELVAAFKDPSKYARTDAKTSTGTPLPLYMTGQYSSPSMVTNTWTTIVTSKKIVTSDVLGTIIQVSGYLDATAHTAAHNFEFRVLQSTNEGSSFGTFGDSTVHKIRAQSSDYVPIAFATYLPTPSATPLMLRIQFRVTSTLSSATAVQTALVAMSGSR